MTKSCDGGVAILEGDIWWATERLRGNIEPAQYKNVILSLIFLRYISDITQEEMHRLQLKVPANSVWKVIAHASHTPEIGVVIDTALRSMAQENPLLASVLIPPFSLSDIDQYRLSDVVDVLDTTTVFNGVAECDVLGQVYEYCLDRFATIGGRSTGEFYTPSSIVKLLVDLIEPFEGRVYDPCCGSGGMFVQSARFVEQHAGNIDNVSIYGQESNPVTWSMAYMNLAIRGISADLGSGHADTLHHDLHAGKQFDFVLANPPFNLKNWGSRDTIGDPRWIYGNPPDSNANFAWLQHMLAHLAPQGRLGVILTNGSLSTQRNGEGRIRQAIIEDDLIEGIVTLPNHLFSSTVISVSMWILNRNKSQPGKTLFIDAQNLGTMTSCRNRILTDDDIASIQFQFEEFRKGAFKEKKGFSAVATIDEIAQCDFSLVPGRYMSAVSSVSNRKEFESTVAQLSDELDDLFEASHALECEIKGNLLRLRKSSR